MMTKNNLKKDYKGYKGYKPNSGFTWKYKYLDKMPWTANTYFEGTSQENAYVLPEKPPKKYQVNSICRCTKDPDGCCCHFNT